MDSILRYLVQIGIPTFFLLSGMGLSFYKTEKSSFATFFLNKFNRLIIPLIACIIFLLIPTLYFE
jgi:predicted permease